MNYDINYTDIFDSLGLSDLAPAEKEKRFQEMQDIIEKEVFLTVWNLLSDEDKKLFEAIEEEEKVLEFFQKKSIDIQSITEEVVQNYREDLLADMAYFEGKLNNKKTNE